MKEHLVTLDTFLELVRKPSPVRLYRGERSARFSLVPSVGRSDGLAEPTVRAEMSAFSRFKLKAAGFAKDLESDLDYLVLSRHHGLRTRLLDWTESAYIALYFAILNFNSSDCFPPCVYVLHSPEFRSFFEIRSKPWDLQEVVFFEPPHFDRRISSQQAYLSLHHDPFVPYDAPNLERFSIIPTPDSLKAIQDLIFQIGIRHGTIYPGLDGICMEINDNPGLLVESLRIPHLASSPWKSSPFSWSCRPWPVTRSLLIEERFLSEFLAFKCDASIVGIGIERDGKKVGVLYGYEPNVGVRILDERSGKVSVFPLVDGSADALRVEDGVIRSYFPGKDVTFRTKRPVSSSDQPRTHSAIFGSEYWSEKA